MSVFTSHTNISSHNWQYIPPLCLYLLSSRAYHHTIGSTFPKMSVFTIHHNISSHNNQYIPKNVCIYHPPQHIITQQAHNVGFITTTAYHHTMAVYSPQCLYLLATTAYHHTTLHSSSTLLSEPDNSYFL